MKNRSEIEVNFSEGLLCLLKEKTLSFRGNSVSPTKERKEIRHKKRKLRRQYVVVCSIS
jgi:hypothetical protein